MSASGAVSPVSAGSIDCPLSVGVSMTSPLVVGLAAGLTVSDGRERACSNSRRAKAASVHSVGGSTGVLGASLANGDRTASTTVDTMSDTTSAGVGTVPVNAGGCCAIAAPPVEEIAVVAAVVPVEDSVTAAVVVVGFVATDGVVDAGGCTASAATLSASTLLVGPVPEAGTDAKADVRVSFPDALPDPADDQGVRR